MSFHDRYSLLIVLFLFLSLYAYHITGLLWHISIGMLVSISLLWHDQSKRAKTCLSKENHFVNQVLFFSLCLLILSGILQKVEIIAPLMHVIHKIDSVVLFVSVLLHLKQHIHYFRRKKHVS